MQKTKRLITQHNLDTKMVDERLDQDPEEEDLNQLPQLEQDLSLIHI